MSKSTNTEVMMTLLKQIVSDNTELKTQLAELKTMLTDIKSNDAAAAKLTEESYRALQAKIDIVNNLNKKSSDALQEAATPKTTKPNRPVFFKRIFTEDREKYIGQLYTQEELDLVTNSDKITNSKSKSSSAITNAIATTIYNEYIKPNKERLDIFENIYTTAYP